MGGAESIPQRQESDPWWPNQQQQQQQECNHQNVATQGAATGITQQDDESWLKLQELSRTVQRLADEHISLTSANRAADRQQREDFHDLRTQHLQHQLMIKKLEEDAIDHQKLMACAQEKLKISEQERDEATDNNKQLNLVIKEVQHRHETIQQENKRLQDQLLIEQKEQQQLLIENKKLAASLENKTRETEDGAGRDEDQSRPEPEAGSVSGPKRPPPVPSPKATEELEKFREQMKSKREARHQALQAISNEMERLRGELNMERAAKCEALQQLEEIKETRAQNHTSPQLEESLAQLNDKTEECQQLESAKEKYLTQIAALNEVVALSKQMLQVRENQIGQLKQSLREIELTVIGNSGPITVALKAEYESQMQNIKDLKALYQERMKVMGVEKETLLREQQRMTEELESETKRSAEFEAHVSELERAISERNNTVSDLQDQLSDSLDQSRNLSNELALINNIFTQMLVGNATDLDKLIKVLQENHNLMTDITTSEECDETAASLPKLLINLISQVNTSRNGDTDSNTESEADAEASCATTSEETTTQTEVDNAHEETGLNLDANDIASKLPKVWKVLIELISQQVVPSTSTESKDICYKTIDTPNGPRLTISVSKTFLRLKDLILEKRSLQKELTNLKQLNGHLESKLMQQERRLSHVSSELRKTWSVVGRMRNQYQHLHTHEKVLRYELQQKRKLLNELKEELEYCREKWVEARKKNSESEVEWRKLRKEFSSRKKEVQDSFNNSGESGYSDERGDDSGDDDTGQRQSPIQDIQPAVNEIDIEDVTVSSSETENTEDSSNSSHNSSLPDLVSISAETTMPPLLIPNDSFTEHNSPIQSEQAIEECPTISLITSLKQQLAQFSHNLERISSNIDVPENLRAVKSIFTLPAIQIPEHLIQELNSKQPVPASIKSKSSGTLKKEHKSPETARNKYKNPEPARNEHRSPEEILDARAARLKRLEEQSQQLFNKITRTSHRSTALSNRLEELHEQYGAARSSTDIPEPPPHPRVQPPQQLPSRSSEETQQACAQPFHQSSEKIQQASVQLSQQLPSRSSDEIQQACTRAHDRSPEDIQQIHTQPPSRSPEEIHQSCIDPSQQLPSQSSTEIQQTSVQSPQQPPNRSPEEILQARGARLKRLEEQCQQLFNKVTRTTERSTTLSNQLDELHQHYGAQDTASSSSSNIPVPPPLPNTLPPRRLPISLVNSPQVPQESQEEEGEENT